MPASRPICVRFDYSMAGTGVGRLSVYDSSREDRVFDKTGHQDYNWITTQETLQDFANESKVFYVVPFLVVPFLEFKLCLKHS